MKTVSNLKTRSLTALLLLTMLAVMLLLRGTVYAVLATACVVLALIEVLRAFETAGHRPVRWPSFVVPGVFLIGIVLMIHQVITIHPMQLMLPLVAFALFGAVFTVMLRESPDVMDIAVSAMPVLAVDVPACCMLSILIVNVPKCVQNLLLTLCFAVSVGGDTLAYFGGSLIGGPKLCPAISPKKTVSGAICGLAGSVGFAVLAGWLFEMGIRGGWFGAPNPEPGLPPLWALALVGLLGGVAGQMGDLFASMLKRHCGIKDFSNLFPGHGGMMDRLDSILFTSVIIYSFSWLIF